MTDHYSTKLLSAVTATGAGNWYKTDGRSVFTFVTTAASVTTGGTVKIQGRTRDETVYDIDTVTVTADGSTARIAAGAFYEIRANVTARTDGTYTVEAEAV